MARALVFAGQGAQFVGMGKDLSEAYPEVKALYDQADEVLGRGLSQICFDGPDDELTKSNNCQPAIFVTSMACLKALELQSGAPERIAVAGLSLGEWSALCAAGALSFESALKALEARGTYMQEACEQTEGGMLSVIGLSVDQCREIAEKAGVEVANLNSSAQTVLSGAKSVIADAEKLATEAGAKRAIVLNVAGAFHSSLMKPAADKLAEFLKGVEISAPSETVLANADGKPHAGPDAIKDAMIRQVHCSVRWLECIEWLKDNGATEYLELGPGKVLSGLIKRIDSSAVLNNIQDKATLDKASEAISG
jgi:[acyl-carrier-protein] S-malonyltransferase